MPQVMWIFGRGEECMLSSAPRSMIICYEFVTERTLALSKSMFAVLVHTLVGLQNELIF